MRSHIKLIVITVSFAGAVLFLQQGTPCFSSELNPEDSFSEANSLYRHNQYDAALSEYEKISGHGLESGNLYYNIGNCYFKKGELGKAMLNYERALIFLPQDSDLRSNYDYARSQLNLGPQGLPGNWFTRGLDKAFAGMNLNTLALFLSFLYVLMLSTILLRMFLGSRMKLFKVSLIVLIMAFVLAATGLYRKAGFVRKGAVVTLKEAQARFEPLEKATSYFTLPEGSKVIVVDESGNWLKVKRQDNKIGWIEKQAVSLVY